MIKNYIFDLGGVLIDLDIQACFNSFQKLGLKHIEQLLTNYGQKGVFRNLEKGIITEFEFYDLLRTEFEIQISDEAIKKAFNDFLLDIHPRKLQLLHDLKQLACVYLLSNTNDIHYQYVVERFLNGNPYHIEDCFHQVFLSQQLHLCKPDLEIFYKVMELASLKPEESLYFDDSLENIQAAEKLGFQVCLITKSYSILDYFNVK